MTLSIFGPHPGGPVGPGIESRTQSTNSDVPAGSVWRIEVQDLAVTPTQVMLRHQFPAVGSTPLAPGFLVGDPRAGTLTFPSFHWSATQGDSVNYVIQLISGTTTQVIDQAQQTQVWDASFYFRLAASSSVTSGFTEEDRDTLTLVKSAVSREEEVDPAGLIPFVSTVIDFFRGPPRSLLRHGGSIPLTGRGVISPLVDTSLKNAYGATWSFLTVPAGFGARDGQLVEWFNRIAQFVVIREDGADNFYRDEYTDEHAEGGTITWKQPFPTEVQYDIAPGCTVIWRWLIGPF